MTITQADREAAAVPTDKVLSVVGSRIDPTTLVAVLRADYSKDGVIEGLQRAIECGHITLDAEGFIRPTAIRNLAGEE